MGKNKTMTVASSSVSPAAKKSRGLPIPDVADMGKVDVTYDALKTYECTRCHDQKPLKEFSPSMLKDWLRGQPNYFRWVCYDCQYPLCKLCVESNDPELQRRRPRDAIKPNALIDNVYYCQEHKWSLFSCYRQIFFGNSILMQ